MWDMSFMEMVAFRFHGWRLLSLRICNDGRIGFLAKEIKELEFFLA